MNWEITLTQCCESKFGSNTDPDSGNNTFVKGKMKSFDFFSLTKKVGLSCKICLKGTASRDLRPRYVAIHH